MSKVSGIRIIGTSIIIYLENLCRQDPVIPSPKLVSPVADVVRRCISQFSWAAGILLQPPVSSVAHSQSNSSVILDEVDAATGNVSNYDHVQQPQQNYTEMQDHVINFHQSPSDPVNRGLYSYWSSLMIRTMMVH